MIFSKRHALLVVAIFLFILLSACGRGQAVEEAEQYISPVEQIEIPDDVKIIGLGEATHGNIEFQALKKDVFAGLIDNEHVRVFVLEGDFGGGQQINQFILHGTGTAEEAVDALDYGIYRTEQVIELVQWMHDYNVKAGEDEKIYFYGNDMQRYDYNKQELLQYYEEVDKDSANKYATQLEHVTNESMRDLTTDQLEELQNIVADIILNLESNEVDYVEQTSNDAFALAMQYAQMIKQRTQLFLNEGNYMKLRDEFLADNLEWIVEFEAARGHDKVFFSGHNGHVEKTSASLAGYKSMGHCLDERYGSEYFAIGTDFIKSEFQAFNASADERQIHSVKSHNDLVDAFRDVEVNIFYVDFAAASESEELATIITSEQKMAN